MRAVSAAVPAQMVQPANLHTKHTCRLLAHTDHTTPPPPHCHLPPLPHPNKRSFPAWRLHRPEAGGCPAQRHNLCVCCGCDDVCTVLSVQVQGEQICDVSVVHAETALQGAVVVVDRGTGPGWMYDWEGLHTGPRWGVGGKRQRRQSRVLWEAGSYAGGCVQDSEVRGKGREEGVMKEGGGCEPVASVRAKRVVDEESSSG